MDEIYNFFQASQWYNILALLTTLVGTLFGIASFIIENRKRIPVYIIQTANIIREIINENDDIRITYRGKEYSNLSSTRFVFWNNGRKTIKRDDVATRNPIKITIDEQYQILDAYIDKQTNTDNNFVIEKTDDNKSLIIKFEFLEYNDGASIRIIHTAPSNKVFFVSGKVISGRNIYNAQSGNITKGINKILSYIRFDYLPLRQRISILRLFFFLMGVLTLLNPYIRHISILQNSEKSILYYLIIYLLGIFYLLIALFGLRRYVPKELEE